MPVGRRRRNWPGPMRRSACRGSSSKVLGKPPAVVTIQVGMPARIIVNRRATLAIAVVLACAVLAGCSGGDNLAPEASPTPTVSAPSVAPAPTASFTNPCPTAKLPTPAPLAPEAAPLPATAAGGGGTITIGTTDTITSLDPGNAYENLSITILQNTQGTLLVNKPDSAELVPELAAALPIVSP